MKNRYGRHTLSSRFIVCPNPDCQKFTLDAVLHESGPKPSSVGEILGNEVRTWSLVPPSAAKSFPDYIPKAIRDDYEEACLIRDLSPKASATLSRRCLQGVLRDFWKVNPGRLVNEIEQIREKTDEATWGAISAVRKLGNIGAHMENDISVIVDVDEGEAGLLIELVETLLNEWYVAREDRSKRMAAITAAAESKKPRPGSSQSA